MNVRLVFILQEKQENASFQIKDDKTDAIVSLQKGSKIVVWNVFAIFNQIIPFIKWINKNVSPSVRYIPILISLKYIK